MSNCVIMWATFASAVGETKLALSAMVVIARCWYALRNRSLRGDGYLNVVGDVKTRAGAVITVEGPSSL